MSTSEEGPEAWDHTFAPWRVRRSTSWIDGERGDGEVWQGGLRHELPLKQWTRPLAWARVAAPRRRRVLVAGKGVDVFEVPALPSVWPRLWTSDMCESSLHRVAQAREALAAARLQLWTTIRSTVAPKGTADAGDWRQQPGLDWFLLTAHPERAEIVPADVRPYVYLGTSASHQDMVEAQVHQLLVHGQGFRGRFLRLSPLLASVDLTRWLPPLTPCLPEEAPKRWEDFTWPEWVPQEVRQQVEEFWQEPWGRGPGVWMENTRINGAPPFGMQVGQLRDGKEDRGRYVHAWNNIGRLVREDGSVAYASVPAVHLLDTSGRYRPPLDWVLLGGDVGPKAQTCHLEWMRAVLRQCRAAGVPCYVERLGTEVQGTLEDALSAAAPSCGIVHENQEPCATAKHWLPLALIGAKGENVAGWPKDLRGREVPRG